MLNFLKNLFTPKPVVDPNAIETGSEDVYTMSLEELLTKLSLDIPADTFLADDEDDTANFEMEMEELD